MRPAVLVSCFFDDWENLPNLSALQEKVVMILWVEMKRRGKTLA